MTYPFEILKKSYLVFLSKYRKKKISNYYFKTKDYRDSYIHFQKFKCKKSQHLKIFLRKE